MAISNKRLRHRGPLLYPRPSMCARSFDRFAGSHTYPDITFTYSGGMQLVIQALTSTPEWWRHQMETFSALLAICEGNSPVPGEFPTQRPVTHSFDVFFDLRLNKRLSKQSWGWWFETLPRPLWRQCNELSKIVVRVGGMVDESHQT